MENKKIMVMVMPLHGHVNPTLGFIQELVKLKANVIFYSIPEFKGLIEKTGAEFRSYSYFYVVPDDPPGSPKKDIVLKVCEVGIDVSDHILGELAAEVEKEKPDLLIYDMLSMHAKYLLMYLKKEHEKDSTKIAPPKALEFSPAFVAMEGIFPTEAEKVEFDFMQIDQDFINYHQQIVASQKRLNEKYGLDVQEPLLHAFSFDEKLIVVSTFPEFQPKSDKFDPNVFKFVGCIMSQVRLQEITNPKLKSILDSFNPVNPIKDISQINSRNSEGLKLVFVSLGTYNNADYTVFDRIIEAFKLFDEEPSKTRSDVKASKLRIIVSLGQSVYENFQLRISNENYQVPNNVLLLPSAPQIQILQRASLFVTHCGMNSASETVNYAVPIIAVPIMSDQPMVAKRLADELKVGIKFNFKSLTPTEFRTAVHAVFNDTSYQQRICEFNETSRKYNGVKGAVEAIQNYLV